jgi:Flp pilus assembly CpaE family ATPase
VPDDAGPSAVLAAARAAIAELDRSGPDHRDAGSVANPRRSLPPPVPSSAAGPGESAGQGKVIAVWGPTGAPGRTTVAAGLADALARAGTDTLLVDADVYGGVLASAFGVLDESPGLAGACRAAANGRLGPDELVRLSWQIAPALRLLTGIARAGRWPELRPSAIGRVLDVARAIAAVTVVDCGFSIEADEEISFDTMAPRRNGATLAVLSGADQVLIVGSADPAGLERVVRAVGDLADTLPAVRPNVVLNRVRGSSSAQRQAHDALVRFSGHQAFAQLPFDLPAMDQAWSAGISVAAAAPRSPLTSALQRLGVASLRSIAVAR